MSKNEIEWTEHESALWQTCNFLVEIVDHDRLPAQIPVGFAHQFSADEVVFAGADFQRSWFGAIGDGSYNSSTFLLGGLSPGGLALGAATLGASALRNSSKKARAQHDATEMWRPVDEGQLFISSGGFYLNSRNGLLAFSFEALAQADLSAPGVIVYTAYMDGGGQEQFALTTIYAELIFALWAYSRAPHHPRLQNLGFLPSEFVERVRYAGVWDSSPLRALVEPQ